MVSSCIAYESQVSASRAALVSVASASEHVVDGRSGALLVVGPEVGVGVEGLGRGRVTEASLDDLDGLAVVDEQRGVEMPQVVEPQPFDSRFPGGRPPQVVKTVATARLVVRVGEDQAML